MPDISDLKVQKNLVFLRNLNKIGLLCLCSGYEGIWLLSEWDKTTQFKISFCFLARWEQKMKFSNFKWRTKEVFYSIFLSPKQNLEWFQNSHFLGYGLELKHLNKIKSQNWGSCWKPFAAFAIRVCIPVCHFPGTVYFPKASGKSSVPSVQEEDVLSPVSV